MGFFKKKKDKLWIYLVADTYTVHILCICEKLIKSG